VSANKSRDEYYGVPMLAVMDVEPSERSVSSRASIEAAALFKAREVLVIWTVELER